MKGDLEITITPAMARLLVVACIAQRANGSPRRVGPAYMSPAQATDHFYYWFVRTKERSFTFTFTERDDGAIGWAEARHLRELLIEAGRGAKGQVRAAIRRRVTRIESALGIDPVTRLGAVV